MGDFNRKELKKIFEAADIEVPKDVLGQICDLHTSSLDGLSDAVKDLKSNLEKAEQERDALKAKAPKEGEEMVSKSELDKLQKEYDDFKNDINAKELRAKKEDAFLNILKNEKISKDWHDVIFKASNDDIEAIEFDDAGNVKNVEKMSENTRTKWAKCIATTNVRGAKTATPIAKSSSSPMTKEQIMAVKDPATRVRLIAENKETLNK